MISNMKATHVLLFFSVLTVLGCVENKSADTGGDSIFPKGRKIDNDNFNGTAWVNMLAKTDSLNQMYAGVVAFEPNARTNWHSHPAGQILIVISGEGYYQEKGQSKRILKKGDTVKCPPNTPHWHGASPMSEFTHIAVSSSEKGPTQWLEPVNNQEYSH